MKEKSEVDEVYKKSDGFAVPTLLVFQNGTLQPIDKRDVLYTKIHDKKKKESALVLIKDQIYMGPIETKKELTDNYICIRNKITNKVRIIPIDEAQLRNNIYNEKEKEVKAKISQEDSYRTLLMQYGGRKAIRYACNKQTMQVDIDIIKDNLNTTLDDSSFIENADDTIESDKYLNSIRVNYNADAQNVENVYSVTDVIPEELLNRLDSEVDKIRETNLENIPIDSAFLKDCLKKVLNKDTDNQSLKIKMILYMDALINLMRSRERSMVKCELSKITEKVENDIKKRFADEHMKGFKRSTYSVEKAMCYFLVLAMMLSDKHEVEIKTIQEELKTTKQKIVKYGHVVFARPKSNNSILSLRLPSTVPPLTTGFGRKKRKL